MSHALPLPGGRYLQYLKTESQAPHQERATTQEIKGHKRYGEGVAYRLYKHHAVVLGRWTTPPPLKTEMTTSDAWGRYIAPEEIDSVAARIAAEKLRTGWIEPKWHWRYYFELVLHWLHPTHLVSNDAYGVVKLTPVRGIRYWWTWSKDRYHYARGDVLDSGEIEDGEWQPLRVVDMDPRWSAEG